MMRNQFLVKISSKFHGHMQEFMICLKCTRWPTEFPCFLLHHHDLVHTHTPCIAILVLLVVHTTVVASVSLGSSGEGDGCQSPMEDLSNAAVIVKSDGFLVEISFAYHPCGNIGHAQRKLWSYRNSCAEDVHTNMIIKKLSMYP